MTSTTPLQLLVQESKALAHPARVRIVAMLRNRELCACQITAVLNLAPSTVSAHLAELRRAGLLAERKEGRWVHYQLTGDGDPAALAQRVYNRVRKDPDIVADAAVVKQLDQIPVAELCGAELDLTRLTVSRP